jgi:aminopeptidase YwaD
MMLRIKLFASLLLLSFLNASAQKLNKNDKITLTNLEAHIHYLADDKLEGRRTGTAGEKAASDYIISELSKTGVQPKGDNNGWLQAFLIDQGREITTETSFSADGRSLVLRRDYFPLALSATGQVSGSPAIALQESGVPWFLDLKELLETGVGNPRFDLPGAIRVKAAACAKKGATALILYNSSKLPDNLGFDPLDRPEAAVIPVLYVTSAAKRKYLRDESASVDIRIRVAFAERQRTGHNVVAYLDNGAASTVIIGAHYDHLGHGEDSNTLYRGTERVVYHGADDNASGVAAMIELARLLKESKLRNNNYLFIAFSGKELGLSGSRYFVEHPATDLKKVNYMLNMDMIGRLNDTTHALTIGGYGTSPVWGPVCNAARDKKLFSLHFDSSAAGSGDQRSFYQAAIPVLFLSTGMHADYHKPGDDYDKINYPGELQVLKFIYAVVEGINARGRMPFTRETATNVP